MARFFWLTVYSAYSYTPLKWLVTTRILRRITHQNISRTCLYRWRFGAVGSDVDRINEVTLRWARLVLGWVTVSGFNSRCGKFISV